MPHIIFIKSMICTLLLKKIMTRTTVHLQSDEVLEVLARRHPIQVSIVRRPHTDRTDAVEVLVTVLTELRPASLVWTCADDVTTFLADETPEVASHHVTSLQEEAKE